MKENETRKFLNDHWDDIMDLMADWYEEHCPAVRHIIGKVMRISNGKANPVVARRLLAEELLKL